MSFFFSAHPVYSMTQLDIESIVSFLRDLITSRMFRFIIHAYKIGGTCISC